MKTLFLLSILLFALPCYSFDEWDTTDYSLQATVLTLTTVDLMQTYTFLYKEPYASEGYSERNPLMGPHPTKKRFFLVGGGWMLFHTGISYILPKKLRTIWQLTYITFETNSIIHNYQCGVRIRFL